MITVAASEFAKNFGHCREIVQAESVAVTSHNRVTGYFISRKEFDKFERLKARATKSYEVQDLPAEAIQALSIGAMDSSHDALNALLRDKVHDFSEPEGGLVVSFAYLWHHEGKKGRRRELRIDFASSSRPSKIKPS